MPSVRTLLRELAARPAPDRTLELIEQILAQPLRARDLLPVHEALLFGKAYPRSRAVYDLCHRTLADFARRVAALSAEEQAALAQTGIAGTHIHYPYEELMARWLLERRGCRVEIDWDALADRERDPISELMPFFLPRALGDAVDDPELATRELIERVKRPAQSSLAWLLEGFARGYRSPFREQTYNSLELTLDLLLEPGGPSRTELDDGPPPRLFVWDPEAARAPVDVMAEINRPLRLPPPVSAARGRELLGLCYGVLLPRLRELYPAIHGNPEEVYDIPLERGIRVIFWFMEPAWRLPLEAGWAILLLKNHVPIGYGAGGLLDDRAEIAINVFDTFRGGEAAWLYTQYARICRAFCRPAWLVTRRYQIGYENTEGLASGSFWFYDKLGFRSVDADIRAMADAEREHLRRHRGRRTARRLLRQLSQADVVLSLEGQAPADYREYPLGAAGMLAAAVIRDRFGGRSAGLEARVLRTLHDEFGWQSGRLPAAERSALAQMGLFALAVPEARRWPARERAALFEFCRLKGSPREADYAGAFRRNRRFLTALRELAESAGSRDTP